MKKEQIKTTRVIPEGKRQVNFCIDKDIYEAFKNRFQTKIKIGIVLELVLTKSLNELLQDELRLSDIFKEL